MNTDYYHDYMISDLHNETLPLSKLFIRVYAKGFAIIKARDHLTLFEPYHDHLLENLEEANSEPRNIWDLLYERIEEENQYE